MRLIGYGSCKSQDESVRERQEQGSIQVHVHTRGSEDETRRLNAQFQVALHFEDIYRECCALQGIPFGANVGHVRVHEPVSVPCLNTEHYPCTIYHRGSAFIRDQNGNCKSIQPCQKSSQVCLLSPRCMQCLRVTAVYTHMLQIQRCHANVMSSNDASH